MSVFPSQPAPPLDIRQSTALLQRAERLIPSATQTIAKGPTQFVRGAAPAYLARGSGCKVWDVDGNEYIDLNMAVGPLSLGYCYPRVDEAIKRQLADGITFSLMHPLEVEVAELIARLIPNAERIRYAKSGADVVSAALRLARARTGRERVVCCGYHGWHDWYAATLPPNAGVPKEVKALTGGFSFNDLDSLLEKLDETVAAVILEPTIFEAPSATFLKEIRAACDRTGAILVFDEMWTGFRIDLRGAQAHFGVRADLITFSKAIANGMPLAVLCGKAEIMDRLASDVFFYTTFGGEALSLAAAQATILEIEEKQVCQALATNGQTLKDGFNHIAQNCGATYLSCTGNACRSLISIAHPGIDSLLLKSVFQQELLRRGLLWSGFHNMSYSHGPDAVASILAIYEEAIPILHQTVESGTAAQALQGLPVQPVFRKTKY